MRTLQSGSWIEERLCRAPRGPWKSSLRTKAKVAAATRRSRICLPVVLLDPRCQTTGHRPITATDRLQAMPRRPTRRPRRRTAPRSHMGILLALRMGNRGQFTTLRRHRIRRRLLHLDQEVLVGGRSILRRTASHIFTTQPQTAPSGRSLPSSSPRRRAQHRRLRPRRTHILTPGIRGWRGHRQATLTVTHGLRRWRPRRRTPMTPEIRTPTLREATPAWTRGWTRAPTRGWTHAWTRGWTRGWTPASTPGWTHGRIPGWTRGPTRGLTRGWTRGWTRGRTRGWTPGRIRGSTHGWIRGQTLAWIPGGTPGWTPGPTRELILVKTAAMTTDRIRDRIRMLKLVTPVRRHAIPTPVMSRGSRGTAPTSMTA
mmetsp:Transcript_89045/g.238431  ORF Transcript_89045/g.238431 Transcript_89045/m.238431 type:complete len:370 (-) Transcript_89045:69-1178(-)